jgi:hypothetical protein
MQVLSPACLTGTRQLRRSHAHIPKQRARAVRRPVMDLNRIKQIIPYFLLTRAATCSKSGCQLITLPERGVSAPSTGAASRRRLPKTSPNIQLSSIIRF